MVGTRVRAQRARRIVIEIDDSTWSQLELVESCDADGILRIAMVGELDLAVAAQLSSRLDQLMRDGTRARLDLSRLEFIDLRGVRTLMRAAQHRNQHGEEHLEIGHDTTLAVRRMFDLVGAGPLLWPTNHSIP